jgi:hypothetical protein
VTEALVSTGSRVLDEIAGVIGTRAALVLGCAFRGERVYIPKDPAREPRIAEAIGQHPHTLWPDRWTPEGTPRPRPAIGQNPSPAGATPHRQKREAA